jgi:4-diphosphocytidyl-2-C-methyl-D-erythritol kinase
MLLFPNAKINIGLFVTGRRADGYHEIESVFYPIGLQDILEINLAPRRPRGTIEFRCTGLEAGEAGDNLVARAYRMLAAEMDLPAARVHLHKLIPAGAGLGGGSADAAFMLMGLNELCALGMDEARLMHHAARLGSDCPFFIHDRPVLARGRGEVMQPVGVSLAGYRVVVVKPGLGVSTAEAYRLARPRAAGMELSLLAGVPVERWGDAVVNVFEEAVAPVLPGVGEIKGRLREAGAVYASMTGSGSAVYGLFDRPVDARALFPGYFTWQGDGAVPPPPFPVW